MHDSSSNLESDRLLETYLNDHLAGAALGIRLMRRIRDENEGTRLAALMDEMLPELEEDEQVLSSVMDDLGLRENKVKQVVAFAGEWVARAKLNRRLITYSPLSRLEELETMALGTHGRQKMWRTLAAAAAVRPALASYDFDALAERAQRQHDQIEEQRFEAGERALI